MQRSSHPTTPDEWLALWRTLWFDLPLEFAGGPRSIESGAGHVSAETNGEPTGENVAATTIDRDAARCQMSVRARGASLGDDDFAQDLLEELQAGCFD